jgi:hypothetical protein
MRHHAAEIRPNITAGAEHVVRTPPGGQRAVGIASATAIFDDTVVAAGALHIALACAALRVAEALIRILNHHRFTGRVDQIDALVEIDALVIATAATRQDKSPTGRQTQQCDGPWVMSHLLVDLDGIKPVVEQELDVALVGGGLPHRVATLGVLIHAHAVVIVCKQQEQEIAKDQCTRRPERRAGAERANGRTAGGRTHTSPWSGLCSCGRTRPLL